VFAERLKQLLSQNVHMSYERFINVLYDDLTEVYGPKELVIEVEFRPRGGISSRLKVDSKWRKDT
jgi:7-cyano-7-deazaguanine reductase